MAIFRVKLISQTTNYTIQGGNYTLITDTEPIEADRFTIGGDGFARFYVSERASVSLAEEEVLVAIVNMNNVFSIQRSLPEKIKTDVTINSAGADTGGMNTAKNIRDALDKIGSRSA